MLITLKRIIKAGFKTFWRNSLYSISSILVMTIALVVSLSTFFAVILVDAAVQHLESKVDIHIYFEEDASEVKILELENLINILEVVEKDKTKYISKEEVLKNFKENNLDEKYIIESLDIIGENPFGAVLHLKTKSLEDYSKINTFLDSSDIQTKFGSIIKKTSYENNKKAIDTLVRLVNYTKLIGSAISIILILISVIITFNTVKLTIYSFREEIAIMRLVGASRFFARGPFVVEGIIYGIIAAIFALFITWGIIFKTAPVLHRLFYLDLNAFFSNYILSITGVLIAGGIVLGFVSTYLAVSRYLKV